MSEDFKQANETLGDAPEHIDKAIDIGGKEGHINSGDDIGFTYKVKPKVSLGKLLKGDIEGAISNTSINLNFRKDFTEDNVQIMVNVNGNLAALIDSPQGKKNFSATMCATKSF